MAWPSWFPQISRPKGWPDWPDIFTVVIPREWPEGLFGLETNGEGDLQATGETLALARDFLEQVLRYLWPQTVIDSIDDDGIWLDDWEAVFNTTGGSSDLTARAERLVAAFRQRGTMTEALVQAIMAPAFGETDPSKIAFESPTAAAVAAASPDEDWQWVFLHTNMHIYHADETTAPDQEMAETLIAKIKPTGDTWSVGQYKRLKWGTPGEEGAWDQATWG